MGAIFRTDDNNFITNNLFLFSYLMTESKSRVYFDHYLRQKQHVDKKNCLFISLLSCDLLKNSKLFDLKVRKSTSY